MELTDHNPEVSAALEQPPSGSDATESGDARPDEPRPSSPQPARIEIDYRRPGAPEGTRDYPTLGYE